MLRLLGLLITALITLPALADKPLILDFGSDYQDVSAEEPTWDSEGPKGGGNNVAAAEMLCAQGTKILGDLKTIDADVAEISKALPGEYCQAEKKLSPSARVLFNNLVESRRSRSEPIAPALCVEGKVNPAGWVLLNSLVKENYMDDFTQGVRVRYNDVSSHALAVSGIVKDEDDREHLSKMADSMNLKIQLWNLGEATRNFGMLKHLAAMTDKACNKKVTAFEMRWFVRDHKTFENSFLFLRRVVEYSRMEKYQGTYQAILDLQKLPVNLSQY